MAKSETNDWRRRVGRYLTELLTGRAPLWRVFWVGVVVSGATIVLFGFLLNHTSDWWMVVSLLFWLWLPWSVVVIWRASRLSNPIVRYPSRILSVAFIPVIVLAPGYSDHPYEIKLWEAVTLSNSHRVALQIACQNGSFRSGLTNEDEELGLAAPQAYDSTYTHSITTRATGADTARVEILLKRISDRLLDGQTVVLEGRCAEAQMHWKVSGDIPWKYREKLARVIEY